METHWHNLKEKEVLEILGTKREGLDAPEVKIRQRKHGLNQLPQPPRITALQIFWSQLKNPLILILFIGGIVSLFLTEYLDGAVIFLAVIINSIIGFAQEYKAEQAIFVLQKMVPIKAKVIREGREVLADTGEIVPGDIVVLDEGDRAPADARLIEAHDLQINEALLTGESFPSEKNTETLPIGAALAERENMVYGGTVALRGRGVGIVVRIGEETEVGKIALSLKTVREEPTPLQREMGRLTGMLSVLIICTTTLLFIFGLLQGMPIREVFLTAIAVVVATVPEGLPIAVTVILVIGMRRILKENALVRRIVAAETLGSVSVVCMDKTGTLTEGIMHVSEIWTPPPILKSPLAKLADELPEQTSDDENNSLSKFVGGQAIFDDRGGKIFALEIGVLCNNAVVGALSAPETTLSVVENLEDGSSQQKMLGDPLEIALLRAGINLGLDRDLLVKNLSRLDEIPFSSEKKYMATLHKSSIDENIIFIKGAPEKIFKFTTSFRCNGSSEYLKDEDKKTIFKKIDEFAGRGERIISLAYKSCKSSEIKMLNHDEKVLCGATFVGFISFKDPLRKDIKDVVLASLRAGVRPVIITGDYLKTAITLSKEAGIKAEKENVMEGTECLKMSDKEFADCIKKINVFARIEPNEKMRIVKILRKNGEVVAMVGDGVNDAPSLKSADIGVSLGTGTDVTKQAADIVLLDNNFKTIISAIKQGRLIFDNIRKVVVFALSNAFGEIILLAGSIIFHTPLPFFPAQILWINIIEDSFPNIALGFDKEESELLKEKPRKKNEPLLNAEMKILVFIVGIVTDVLLFGLFYYLWKTTDDLKYARTMVFAGLAISTLLYVFAIRTLREPMWKRNPFGNKFLTGAVIFGFLMLVAGLYVGPLQTLLRTMPLSLRDWLILIPLGIINVVLIELVKGIFFFVHLKRKKYVAREKLVHTPS